VHDSPARLTKPNGNNESAAMASDLSPAFIRQFCKRNSSISIYKYWLCLKNSQAVQGAWRGKLEEKMEKKENLVP
jgi:hypothetical protein